MEMRVSESVCMFEFVERERVCVCARVCLCVGVHANNISSILCCKISKLWGEVGRGVSEDCTDPGSGQSNVL